jgi:predicted ATPase
MLHRMFLGRDEEQNHFRGLLKDICDRSKRDEGVPTVILLYGQGGIGKTALARQFRQIVNDEFTGKFQTFFAV